jgi:GDP-D-mannose dehydratase
MEKIALITGITGQDGACESETGLAGEGRF